MSAGDGDISLLQRSCKENGRYVNPWPTFKWASLSGLLKFAAQKNPKIPKNLDEVLPVLKPDGEYLRNQPEKGIRVTWIGHATTLVQMEGLNILTDPVFSERCSMTQYIGPKRYRPPPLAVQDLPQIDAVVISHNHFDHLDYNSVKDLNKSFGETITWFVPINLGNWMKSSGCSNVVELDWWEEANIASHPDVKFACVPAQHWSKRGLFDTCKTLWGGWCILGKSHKFYFAGDTGYCTVFKEIGKKYGPFDLAAIPIGAYIPRDFLRPQHVDPEHAVEIHCDVQAKKSLGIHWGTFPLSCEEILDPPRHLAEALDLKGLKIEDFFTLKHGESKHVE